MKEITTTDLSKFGSRERNLFREILNYWCDYGLPRDFSNDEVVPMMNTQSGYVFLTNSDYQVAMMNGKHLESFYTCPECGFEGFFDEIRETGKDCCNTYVRECRGLD